MSNIALHLVSFVAAGVLLVGCTTDVYGPHVHATVPPQNIAFVVH